MADDTNASEPKKIPLASLRHAKRSHQFQGAAKPSVTEWLAVCREFDRLSPYRVTTVEERIQIVSDSLFEAIVKVHDLQLEKAKRAQAEITRATTTKDAIEYLRQHVADLADNPATGVAGVVGRVVKHSLEALRDRGSISDEQYDAGAALREAVERSGQPSLNLYDGIPPPPTFFSGSVGTQRLSAASIAREACEILKPQERDLCLAICVMSWSLRTFEKRRQINRETALLRLRKALNKLVKAGVADRVEQSLSDDVYGAAR